MGDAAEVTHYHAPLLDLFPYQQEAAQWLATKRRAALGHSMGLGKSAAAIRACDLVAARNILTLCPASTRQNWAREWERFSPFDRPCQVILSGKDKPRSFGVVITSYEMAVTHANLLKSAKWDVVIADELHFLKCRSSRRTKVVYGVGSRSPGIASNADHFWGLSGTIMPNNASELYPHLRFAGLVEEDFWSFTFKFCSGFESSCGWQCTGHKNVDELKRILKPFLLRRTKEEVLKDLPEVFYQTVTVPRSGAALPPEFVSQESELQHADTELQVALAAMSADNQVTALEASASSMTTLRRYTVSLKLPAIAEQIIEDLENGIGKILVFGVHRSAIEWMAEKLKGYGAVTLYGGTAAVDRQKHIDRFRDDPACRVLVGNIQTAGTGVDGLQKNCNEAVFMECSWVPSEIAQAATRLLRIGQKNPVRARIFSLYGSVDERVQAVLTNKTRELAKIL